MKFTENKKISLFDNINNNGNVDKENNPSNKVKLITEENYLKNFKASIYLKENKNSFFGCFAFYNLKKKKNINVISKENKKFLLFQFFQN